MTLQRLVLDYRSGELVVRCLYRSQDGPGPSFATKARGREVSDLVRTGLREALRALEEDATTLVGTSGFTTREDVLLATISPDTAKLVKGA
jgi:uncharacterized membrane protein